MKEDLLHYLFKTKQLGNQFSTTEGANIQIENFGHHNQNSGPDFLNASYKSEGLIWNGHFEFHVKSSDWYSHKHDRDIAYNNVILHFVYENDKPVYINNSLIPTIELKHSLSNSLLDYSYFNPGLKIPCKNLINDIPEEIIDSQQNDTLIQRLTEKSTQVINDFNTFKGDQKKVLFGLIAKALGGKINGEQLKDLLYLIDLRWLGKLNFSSQKSEALLLGYAGLLENLKSDDEYIIWLQSEFEYQKKLFQISPINPVIWKYSRMHPVNFPDIRIAQMAAILCSKVSFLNFETPKEISHFFNSIVLNEFWDNHFQLGHPTTRKSTNIGKDLSNRILINAIIPFTYAQGMIKNDEQLKKRAIDWLKKIPAEKNKITRNFKNTSIKNKTAFHSQAIIQLYNTCCKQKKCLFCKIGKEILNSNEFNSKNNTVFRA